MSVQQLRPSVSLVALTQTVSDTSTDHELVIACQNGDSKAFDLLMKRHRKTIFATLNRLAPDWASQHDDFSQEAMIRVYRGIKTLRNPHAFKAWLNQTITNLFYDELRRKPALSAVSIDSTYMSDDSSELVGMDLPDPSGQPDEIFARKEIMTAVNGAIAKLPKNYRDVIVLRELEGLAYEEIAKATNADLGTVKSRLSRARSRVQSIVEPSLNCA
jgi:RNA polymerase sigma-70 factor (ECF subfamily)